MTGKRGKRDQNERTGGIGCNDETNTKYPQENASTHAVGGWKNGQR